MRFCLKVVLIGVFNLLLAGESMAQGAGPVRGSVSVDPPSSAQPPHLVCVTYEIAGGAGSLQICTYPDGTVHAYLIAGGNVEMMFPSLEALCDYLSQIINYFLELIDKKWDDYLKCLEGPNPNECVPPDTSEEQAILDIFLPISENHCIDNGSSGNIN